LTIPAGSKISNAEAITTTSFNDDDEYTIEILTVGSTESGRGLIVTMLVQEV
jgi:hypothetical protein